MNGSSGETGQAIARVLMLELEAELELVAEWVVWAARVRELPTEVAEAAATLARALVFPHGRERWSIWPEAAIGATQNERLFHPGGGEGSQGEAV